MPVCSEKRVGRAHAAAVDAYLPGGSSGSWLRRDRMLAMASSGQGPFWGKQNGEERRGYSWI